MSFKDVSIKTSRNAFDLSGKVCFTSKAGELLPVRTVLMLPGDKITVDTKSFSRTQPLNTASYIRQREYYDFFFVPFHILWNKFNTFVTQMTHNAQHAIGIGDASPVGCQPYFTPHDIQTYLKTLYRLDDIVDTTAPDLIPWKRNAVGRKRSYATRKLLQYLGYGTFDREDGENYLGFNVKMSPFPLLAYQKVYYDFFRNQQWEKSNPSAFNVDYIQGSVDAHLPIADLYDNNTVSGQLCPLQDNMFDLRYANYKKDYFFGLLPNSQFGDTSVVPINFDSNIATLIDEVKVSSLVQGETSAGDTALKGKITGPSGTNGILAENLSGPSILRMVDHTTLNNYLNKVLNNNIGGLNTTGLSGNFSILSLRGYEALQRFREVAQTTSQSYRDQIKKNFGVTVPEMSDDVSRYIGGVTCNLDINEVVNNNITGDNSAEIAGKGTSSGSGTISFTSEEHGIFICIYHNEPLLDYASQGVDSLCLKTQVSDYPLPAFDRIGMQQVSLIELCNQGAFVADLVKNHGVDKSNPPMLGYAPRYVDVKSAYDKVLGGFSDQSAGLSAWTSALTPEFLKAMLGDLPSQIGNSGLLTYPFFKVNASLLNSVFAVDVDDTTATDQFLTNCFFDIKKVSNLDYDGLPY